MEKKSLIRVVITRIMNEKISNTILPCIHEVSHREVEYFFVTGNDDFSFKIPKHKTTHAFSFWNPMQAKSFEKSSNEVMYDEYQINAGSIWDKHPGIAQIKDQLIKLKLASQAYQDCLQQVNITFYYNSMEKLENREHHTIQFSTSTSHGEMVELNALIEEKKKKE